MQDAVVRGDPLLRAAAEVHAAHKGVVIYWNLVAGLEPKPLFEVVQAFRTLVTVYHSADIVLVEATSL